MAQVQQSTNEQNNRGQMPVESNRQDVGYEDLASKIRTAEDAKHLLSDIMQRYVPPGRYLTTDYAKKVLSGEKIALKNQDVELITVPLLEEFSLKTVFPKLKKNMRLAPYMPDLKEKKYPDYTWFYNVVNTVLGGLEGRIREAYQARNGVEGEARKAAAVTISTEYLDAIKDAPYLSKKSGKFGALLKKNNKTKKKEKKKRFTPVNFTW